VPKLGGGVTWSCRIRQNLAVNESSSGELLRRPGGASDGGRRGESERGCGELNSHGRNVELGRESAGLMAWPESLRPEVMRGIFAGGRR
jgi:hypothetical protein